MDDGAWKRLLEGAATSRYARGKEGLLVRYFFRDRQGGVFVDVGCASPERDSGTCDLERHLGWSGVAVDRLDLSEAWRDSRPHSRFIRARLAEASGKDEDEEPATTLDRVLERAGVDAFDFLAISVDGRDLRVLKGLDLRRYRPQLIKIACGPGQRVPTIEHLDGFGYRLLRDLRPYDKIHRYFAPEPEP
ncbi:MAG: FkbM family methyltransferase [Acidobacteriota bacterium]